MKTTIPILAETDVVVLGGSTAAVAAALAARRAGRRVLCASRLTYLGEDVCASLNYWGWGQSGETASLAPELFCARPATACRPSPLAVKRTLEAALIEAGVELLYLTYPLRPLRTAAGEVAGVVVANRSGLQAIVASVVIDASERATLARQLPEARFREFVAGEYGWRWRAASNDTAEVARVPGRRLPGFFRAGERDLLPFEWELSTKLADASPGALARADVAGRLATWHPGQLLAANQAEMEFGDRLISAGHRQEQWNGAARFDLAAMRCGSTRVFVLGPQADLADSVAAILRDPCAALALGDRLGGEAAKLGGKITGPLRVDDGGTPAVAGLDIVRRDSYFRLAGGAGIEMDLNCLPVLGEFDVVVAGGGTGGAPAGIAAARAGASTLVLEYLSGLGGVGTEGRISSYYHGNRCGFTTEIDQGVAALGRAGEFKWDAGTWNTEWKKQWYLRAASEAGAEVWFGALTVAAAKRGERVAGVVVATPYGCGLVKAGVVVDATGNADVAAAAGAETINISKAHVAVQGTGLAPFVPGQHYTNTDYTFVDDTDVVDLTRAFCVARAKFAGAFDLAQLVDSRQRQQIRGELALDPLDFLAGRTFPDTVTTAMSNFDSHGFTIHPVFMAKAPDHAGLSAHIPYRCLLPVGLEGILVTGLGVGAHRDALPVIRMQPDVQNQGYAAGRAAAMAAAAKCGVRDIDIKALQQHLVDKMILAREVPGQVDSFPLPDAAVVAAVADGIDDYLGLAVIFADPARSLPLLRRAYAAAGDAGRQLRYAHLLGLLGDDTGIDSLTAAVDARGWDQGWNFTGMGQFGFSLSEIDSQLIAIGLTGNPKGLPTLLAKLDSLTPTSEFSHFRAISQAFEAMPSPAAAPRFAALVKAFGGNSKSDLAAAVDQVPANSCDTSERNRELTELLLARGLLACGDQDGLARTILQAYAKDLHGHYARHARALLENR